MEFFRYKNVNTTAGVRVYEWKYVSVKETPAGCWITFYVHAGRGYDELKKMGALRWVSKTSKKRYAYDTREQAWTNYQLRKLREIKILEARLKVAKSAYGCEQPKTL